MKQFAKILMVSLMSLILVCLPACEIFPGFQDKVVTTSDQVDESYTGPAVAVPVESLPKDAQNLFPGQTNLVVVAKDGLKPTATNFVELNPQQWNQGTVGTVVNTIIGGLGTFIPGAAPFAPLLALLFSRPRDHALEAVNNLATGKFKAAGASVLKVAGLLHSDSDTKAVWNETAVATPVKPA